ncbi:FxLYD domain-containing protein [Halovivax gelatinilyticus]|uniref:FxLYD domain-containing protein n=1 Tax=Halovivax gelatinilyticus TaxID=2961597 RepID=UPI0020CA8FBB|nr:FxLYD domain-containing protein [Halovivax gelatinilyticus]
MSNADAPGDRSRRGLLAAIGSLPLVLAGCLDGRSVTYESGEIPDLDADPRTSDELTAAEAIADTDVREGVSPLGDLSIVTHEFVLEDGYEGATVQGIVANEGSDRIELVEVRVRAFDADGTQLGRYASRTGDLAGDGAWSFTVVLLENPQDLDRYEIAVLGAPT